MTIHASNIISPMYDNALGNKAFVEMLYELSDDCRSRANMIRHGLIDELTKHGNVTEPNEVRKAMGVATSYANRLNTTANHCIDLANILVTLTVELRELNNRHNRRMYDEQAKSNKE